MESITLPATVRELGQMAEARGMKASELLEELAAQLPTPQPPAGYTLAEGCSDYYVGTETKTDAWVVAAGWDADTATHQIEAWTVKDQNLTPAQALEMAAALTAAAKAGHA
ncbi:hypothetical protein [Arthrobacter sp. UYEF21]|uniref:hypothetical protein n=1 Tax=Arthrobacter sp. UYEF21 TaxID=1756364 RepID=UPI003399BA4D